MWDLGFWYIAFWAPNYWTRPSGEIIIPVDQVLSQRDTILLSTRNFQVFKGSNGWQLAETCNAGFRNIPGVCP